MRNYIYTVLLKYVNFGPIPHSGMGPKPFSPIRDTFERDAGRSAARRLILDEGKRLKKSRILINDRRFNVQEG